MLVWMQDTIAKKAQQKSRLGLVSVAVRTHIAAGAPSYRVIRAAFTLIELLVVIAIISLLVSILLPSLKKAKGLAMAVVCANNERSIGIASQLYRGDSDDYFPPYRIWDGSSSDPATYQLFGFDGIDPEPKHELGLLSQYIQQAEEGVYCPGYEDQFVSDSFGSTNVPTKKLYSYGPNLAVGGWYDAPAPGYTTPPVQANRISNPAGTVHYADVVGSSPYMTHMASSWLYRPYDGQHANLCEWLFCDGHVEAYDEEKYYTYENFREITLP